MVTQVDFQSQTFAKVTGGLSGTAPEMFVASSDQTSGVITTSGAIADMLTAELVKVGDVIYVNGDQDGTPFQNVYTVTATGGGSLIPYPNAVGGALLAANNLSDVANAATSLTNLGVKRGVTSAYAGGGTSNAFTATGLAATDIVVATILASTNSVSITKAVPTANTLTVTFSADPGAGTTVQWHALPAA